MAAERLVAHGALSEARRRLVEAAAAEHLRADADDVAGTLAGLHVPTHLARTLHERTDAGLAATLSLPPPVAAEHARPMAARGEGGRQVRGRYRILRHHAAGALGTVSVTLDTEPDREVALKEVLAQAPQPPGRRRTVRAGSVGHTARLQHPGIVPVHGMGRCEGMPYYAMRLVRGRSLRQAIDDFRSAEFATVVERSLAFRELLGRFTAVCDAVHYAHSRGVVHRDLKPDNVMFGRYAEDACRLAIDRQEIMVDQHPWSPQDHRVLATSFSHFLDLLTGRGEASDAQVVASHALSALRTARTQPPQSPVVAQRPKNLHRKRASVRRRRGNQSAAADWIEAAGLDDSKAGTYLRYAAYNLSSAQPELVVALAERTLSTRNPAADDRDCPPGACGRPTEPGTSAGRIGR